MTSHEGQNRYEELNAKLRIALGLYERRRQEGKTAEDNVGILEILTQIEEHLYGINVLDEGQIAEIIEPYQEEIERRFEEETKAQAAYERDKYPWMTEDELEFAPKSVTRKVKIRLEIGSDGTVEDVQVYNGRDSCNYMGSKTPEQTGEAVADFLRDYLPEVKWE